MAKLYFKYGTMGSSKTAQALMTRFNYLEKKFSVWLIKPSVDNRDNYIDDNGNEKIVIKSRIGIEADAFPVNESHNLYEIFKNKENKENVIICDECQFLLEKQVEQLRKIVDVYDIPVLCFGLRTDFRTKLFPGSKRLFEIADNISEIKSICSCGDKSVVNGKFDKNGNIIHTGTAIDIGGNEKYKGMCYKCWKSKINKQYLEDKAR